jgi:hypothetical protein
MPATGTVTLVKSVYVITSAWGEERTSLASLRNNRAVHDGIYLYRTNATTNVCEKSKAGDPIYSSGAFHYVLNVRTRVEAVESTGGRVECQARADARRNLCSPIVALIEAESVPFEPEGPRSPARDGGVLWQTVTAPQSAISSNPGIARGPAGRLGRAAAWHGRPEAEYRAGSAPGRRRAGRVWGARATPRS